MTTENLFAAGDHVIQTGRTRATVVATGAAFNMPKARDSKVVALRPLRDTPAMLAALGR